MYSAFRSCSDIAGQVGLTSVHHFFQLQPPDLSHRICKANKDF